MQTFKSRLEHLVQVSASGIDHPYFATSVLPQARDMYAIITSYPPLGHETVVPHDEDTVRVQSLAIAQTEH